MIRKSEKANPPLKFEPVKSAFIFILCVSALRLVFLPLLGLMPQDAYYWQYSKHLSLGYFDHPPVHAWTAWLTTSVFGDNAFGIRFGPWLYGVGLLFLIFALARRLFDNNVAFWTVVAAGVTPLFNIGGSILTPDPPLLFFWTLTIFLGYIAYREDRGWLWILAGFSGGLAMLSKYTAVFLVPGFLIFLLLTERGRKILKTPFPYLGILAAIIAFLPQIIWNAQNHWASFAFQSTRRAGEITKWRLDLFGGMLGSQIAIVSPLIFFGLIWASFRALYKGIFGTKDNRQLYLALFTLPIILFFGFVALRYWVKLNWFAPAYVTGAIAFISAFANEKRIKPFLKWAIAFAAVETILLYAAVLIPAVPLTGEAAYWAGWKELANRVQSERALMPPNTFVAGWGYKVPSELRFYLPDKPETHSNEILGFNGLNYTYWTETDSLKGMNCIFVADSREPFREPELLKKHFRKVEETPELKPIRGVKEVTTYRIWRCFGYIGP